MSSADKQMAMPPCWDPQAAAWRLQWRRPRRCWAAMATRKTRRRPHVAAAAAWAAPPPSRCSS